MGVSEGVLVVMVATDVTVGVVVTNYFEEGKGI